MEPTIGRIVLFVSSEPYDEMTEHAAIITKVHSDTTVNLTVFFSGMTSCRDSVVLNDKKWGWKWPEIPVKTEDKK